MEKTLVKSLVATMSQKTQFHLVSHDLSFLLDDVTSALDGQQIQISITDLASGRQTTHTASLTTTDQ